MEIGGKWVAYKGGKKGDQELGEFAEANNSLRCFFDTYKWQKERKTIIFNYYLRMSKKSSTFAKFVENRNDST